MPPKCICRWACGIRFRISFSVSLFRTRITQYETRVGTRCVIYAIRFPESRGESLCRGAFGGSRARRHIPPVDDSHAAPQTLSFDRQSLVRARSFAGVLATLSSRLLSSTPRHVAIYAEDASFDIPQQVDAKSASTLSPPHLAVAVFVSVFFSSGVSAAFFVFTFAPLMDRDKSPRDSRRGTRALRFFLRVMPCATHHSRSVQKKIIKYLKAGDLTEGEKSSA